MPTPLDAHVPDALRGSPRYDELAQRAAWAAGALGIPLERLAPALGARLNAAGAAALEGIAVEDLVLAQAALAGEGDATARFSALVTEEVSKAVRRLDVAAEDVVQAVHERLLVARQGRPPRLADYTGQGALAGYVRAVAVRTALNSRRPQARETPVAEPPVAASPAADPELELLRARHRARFREAFATAAAALSSRERAVLRLHTLDGLSLARIGAMYGKDASTVSRWLDAARTTLRQQTRQTLQRLLQLESVELDSVLRAADTDLSVSLSRVLAPSGSKAEE